MVAIWQHVISLLSQLNAHAHLAAQCSNVQIALMVLYAQPVKLDFFWTLERVSF